MSRRGSRPLRRSCVLPTNTASSGSIGGHKRKQTDITDYFASQPKKSAVEPLQDEIDGGDVISLDSRNGSREASADTRISTGSVISGHATPSSSSVFSQEYLMEDASSIGDSLATEDLTATEQIEDTYISSMSRYRNLAFVDSETAVHSPNPLPALQWADSAEVWTLLREKEAAYTRDADMMKRHSPLQPRMRTILLDWLVEVCEVYRLHRETFYLAVDFIDRYLSCTSNVPKQQLQLIGISCLFIAAKMEEIYPPKLAEFAYVTDGACSEMEIQEKELTIMKALQWDLTPVTVVAWLSLYMQVSGHSRSKHLSCTRDPFEKRKFSGVTFVQVAQLLDLVIMDLNSVQYPYSVVAASAMYHFVGSDKALSASGYRFDQISSCLSWMTPFAMTIKESEAGVASEVRTFPQVQMDDCHNIQTHVTDLQLLESAQARLEEIIRESSSPQKTSNVFLTPSKRGTRSRTKSESSTSTYYYSDTTSVKDS